MQVRNLPVVLISRRLCSVGMTLFYFLASFTLSCAPSAKLGIGETFHLYPSTRLGGLTLPLGITRKRSLRSLTVHFSPCRPAPGVTADCRRQGRRTLCAFWSAKRCKNRPTDKKTADPERSALFAFGYATRSRTPCERSASTTTVSPSWSLPSMMSVESGSSTLSMSVRLSERTP